MDQSQLSDKITDVVSYSVPISAISSPLWMPTIKTISEDCALWLPIIGVVALLVQAAYKFYFDYRQHRDHKDR